VVLFGRCVVSVFDLGLHLSGGEVCELHSFQ